MATRKTARGVSIDMDTFVAANARMVAAGNMNVNARGDRLARGGEIVETAQEETRAYYEGDAKAVKQTETQSIKEPITARDRKIAANAKKRAELKEKAAASSDDWIEDADGNFVKKETTKKTKGKTSK